MVQEQCTIAHLPKSHPLHVGELIGQNLSAQPKTPSTLSFHLFRRIGIEHASRFRILSMPIAFEKISHRCHRG
jgi:hypothetical protein